MHSPIPYIVQTYLYQLYSRRAGTADAHTLSELKIIFRPFRFSNCVQFFRRIAGEFSSGVRRIYIVSLQLAVT